MHPDPTEEIEIPGTLTVVNAAYAFDGGSIWLGARDAGGTRHGILLVQHMSRRSSRAEWLPGRLYYDGKLLPVRSQAEKRLVEALRAAQIRPEPASPVQSDDRISPSALLLGEDIREYLSAVERDETEAIRLLVERLVTFVQSEAYAKFAAKTESALIRSVLILKAPGNNRVAVMKILRQALRLSLDEAKSIIEQTGAELARGSKLEIDRVRNDLVAAGATVEQISWPQVA